MTGPAVMPVWAGIVVRDLERSASWYADAFGLSIGEQGPTFAVVRFGDGSAIELVAGDPGRPGTAFPSYGEEPGPPVMPGFRVESPADVARGMVVARWLPDWMVVVGPCGLRSVLCTGQGEARTGLIGFEVAGPQADELGEWFTGFGASVPVRSADCLHVVPRIAGLSDAELVDPDGTLLRVVG